MLIGEYTHTVDEKNRISLPVKFRKELGRKIVVTHGLDNCLFLYPEKEWLSISEKLSKLGIGQSNMRGMSRFMLAGAVEIEVDSIGRILIPDFLKEFARSGRKWCLPAFTTALRSGMKSAGQSTRRRLNPKPTNWQKNWATSVPSIRYAPRTCSFT
jgi:division/cell wall cluster transcriptional repressor MraZ